MHSSGVASSSGSGSGQRLRMSSVQGKGANREAGDGSRIRGLRGD